MSYCERFFNFDVFRNEMPISIVSKINIIRKYILTSYIHIYTLLYSLISKKYMWVEERVFFELHDRLWHCCMRILILSQFKRLLLDWATSGDLMFWHAIVPFTLFCTFATFYFPPLFTFIVQNPSSKSIQFEFQVCVRKEI